MKVLSICAPQDDGEFRSGGLAALLAQNGHEVKFLSVCNGSGGHHILSGPEISARRFAESQIAAGILGIEYEIWSDVDDCSIEPTLALRRRMIRAIRRYNPDVIITHRTNDYHADHRTVGMLVQDASYMLIVPHECPDVPAMKQTPVILYNLDYFKYPPFTADVVVDIDSVIDKKLAVADANVSQVYEWLPWTKGETDVPPAEDHDARYRWLCGMDITADTTDEEVLAAGRGYAVRFAKPAAQFRCELVAKYGEERGSRIRFAEAYCLSEYGKQLNEEERKTLFGV